MGAARARPVGGVIEALLLLLLLARAKEET